MSNKEKWDHTLPLEDSDFLERGLLWYINRVAFHARGMALGLDAQNGKWFMYQSEGEPICFAPEIDDEKFQAFEELLRELGNA